MAPKLLGIVNCTPDSFFDGGRNQTVEAALALGLRFEREGAGALDIGGESTRPGAKAVSTDEEKRRVLPVVEGLGSRTGLPISIDTSKAAVAEAALAAGASWVNDVSAFRNDPRMAEVCAREGAKIILMHIGGGATPTTMQANPRYDDVVGEILSFFEGRIEIFLRSGGRLENVLLDPGIGFGKTLAHNLELLERIDEFKRLGRPIVVGASRKSFIGRMMAGQWPGDKDLPADQIPGPEERLAGSLKAAKRCAEAGVQWLRVHDVAETRRVVSAIHVGAR